MEVRPADAAGEDAEQSVAFGEGGSGDVFDLKGLVGGVKDGSFHQTPPYPPSSLMRVFENVGEFSLRHRRYRLD